VWSLSIGYCTKWIFGKEGSDSRILI